MLREHGRKVNGEHRTRDELLVQNNSEDINILYLNKYCIQIKTVSINFALFKLCNKLYALNSRQGLKKILRMKYTCFAEFLCPSRFT